MSNSLCPNCGASGVQTFCPACGQAAPHPDDFRFRHFFADIFSSITNLEGRFFRTIFALIIHPGRLTRDYFDGRRQRYLKPVQLFVGCNVLYFLTQSVQQMNTLTTPVRSQLTQQMFSGTARALWKVAAPSDQIALAKQLDPWMAEQAKTLVFLLVGIYAFMLWPILFWRKSAYAHHLVFAVHFISFVLLLLPVMALQHQWLPGVSSDLLLAIVFFVYFWQADVTAYGLSRLKALPFVIYQLAALIVSISLYRLLMFAIALVWHGALF